MTMYKFIVVIRCVLPKPKPPSPRLHLILIRLSRRWSDGQHLRSQRRRARRRGALGDADHLRRPGCHAGGRYLADQRRSGVVKDLELLIGIVGMMVISGLVVTLLITLLFEWAAR